MPRKSLVVALAAILMGACAPEPDRAPPLPPGPDDWRIQPLDLAAVQIDDPFWSPRMERNQSVTIPHIIAMNEETGRHDNFRKAGGLMDGDWEGYRFNDSDVYKTVEAASLSLIQNYDADLDARLDEIIEIIAAAQEDDGYIFPAYTLDPANPPEGVSTDRWAYTHAGSHELYGPGHLIEAAVAHHKATGKDSLLTIAVKAADLIDATFGPDGIKEVPGHQEIEIALIKLAQTTGEERYVELARFFLDQRGHPHDTPDYPDSSRLARYNDPRYRQDHLPVGEQREALGHSVRAMYLFTGMADMAAHRDDTGYEPALEGLWNDVVGRKMYLTGGIGAAGNIEGFGDPYQLPNETAYAETCAAIGMELWNHRMFLATGESRFVDIMERAIYNGILSGVSQQGDSFFYTNPLESDGERQRQEYYSVACCPSNIARLVAQLPGLVYAQQGDVIYVNLFVSGSAEIELPDGTAVRVVQETRYPWDENVRISVETEQPTDFELRVRVPGWAAGGPVPTDLYEWADDTTADWTANHGFDGTSSIPTDSFRRLLHRSP